MAVQVMQAIVREAGMREQTHLIQTGVRRLLEDVGRLRDRVGKRTGPEDTREPESGDLFCGLARSRTADGVVLHRRQGAAGDRHPPPFC
jgi:hypothetical protein